MNFVLQVTNTQGLGMKLAENHSKPQEQDGHTDEQMVCYYSGCMNIQQLKTTNTDIQVQS